MTPAEKMASELRNQRIAKFNESMQVREDAAAMIRRLAAALVDSYNCVPTHIQLQLSLYHADALRDVREQA